MRYGQRMYINRLRGNSKLRVESSICGSAGSIPSIGPSVDAFPSHFQSRSIWEISYSGRRQAMRMDAESVRQQTEKVREREKEEGKREDEK